jgi:hypothetical protein
MKKCLKLIQRSCIGKKAITSAQFASASTPMAPSVWTRKMGKVVSGSQTNRALAQSVRAFWLSTSSNRDPGEVTTAVRIRVVWRGFFSVGALCKDRENGVLHGAGAHTG